MGTSATPIGRDESVAGEQRQSKRKVVSEAVAIELPPGMEARLRDVSESGLSISSGSPLELGTTTSFRFELPDATAVIDAEGVVVWSDDSGRSGLRFTRVEPDAAAALQRWLSSGANAYAVSSDLPLHDADLAAKVVCLREVADLQAIISAERLERSAALDLIVRRLAELTRASGAAIALREGEDVVCRATIGNAPEVGVRLSASSLSGECLRTGKIVLLEDSNSDPRVDPEICRRLDFRSLLILPVISDTDTVGIAEVLSPRVRNFEGGDVLVLSFLTDLIATVAAAEPEAQERKISALPSMPQAATASKAAVPAPAKPLREISRPKPQVAVPPVARVPAAPFLIGRTPSAREIRPGITVRLLPTAILIALLVIGSVFSSYYLLRKPVTPTRPATGARPSAATPESSAVASSTGPTLSTSSGAAVAGTPAKPSRTSPARSSGVQPPPHEGSSESSELRVIQKHSIDGRPSPEASAPEPLAMSELAGRTTEVLPAAIVAAKPPAPDLQLTQSQGVTQGKLLKKVMPRYPEMARRAGVSGDVVLAAIIGADGTLHDLKVISGSPLLRDEAIAAAKQWRYSPYLLGGKPVETDTHITISFHR